MDRHGGIAALPTTSCVPQVVPGMEIARTCIYILDIGIRKYLQLATSGHPSMMHLGRNGS
jgi:hypothetical protein